MQQMRERVAKGADLRVLVKIEELRGLNSVRLPRYIGAAKVLETLELVVRQY